MNQLKSIIEKNSKNFEHFEYYYLLIEKVEKNLQKNPDIAIECCKSLIEGICTTILVSLDNSLSQEKILKDYNLQKIFKEYKEKLAEHNRNFELDFVNGFNHSVKLIGEIRTKRGDVAHGKKAPKEQISSVEFALFISKLTSSLLVYSLEHFFIIEIFQSIQYEDNSDFNEMLDESMPLSLISYSKALFEQDNDSYIEQLKTFESDKEDVFDTEEREEISDTEEREEISDIEEREEISDIEEREEISLSNIIDKYSELSLIENAEENLNKICDNNDLYINEILEVIDTYLFDKREPLSSSIIKVLKVKPKLLGRDEKVKEIKELIFKFIDEFIVESK